MPIIVILVCFDKKFTLQEYLFYVRYKEGSDNAVAEDSHQRCDTVSSGKRFRTF